MREGIEGLRAKQMAFIIEGSRVTKFSQRISETLNLGRRERAIRGVLLLRGPQTLGELKDRSERLFSFADLSEVEIVLNRLAERPGGGLAVKLPRQPGQKEARYAHLLAGEPTVDTAEQMPISGAPSRLSQLEEQVEQLREQVATLQARFDALEAQFK